MLNKYTWAATLVSASLLSACSDSSSLGGSLGNPGDPTDSRLRSFENQEAFFAALEDALIRNPFGSGGYGYQVDGLDGGGFIEESNSVADGGSSDGSGTTGSSAPQNGGSDSAAGGDGSSLAPESNVTGTNVQEVGVDEADRVKTASDGQHLYVLQSNYGQYDSVPGPAPEPLQTDQASSTQPVQYNGTTLRVLALDASAPDAMPVSNVHFDFGGRLTDGMYLHEADTGNALIMTSSGGGYYDYWDDSYQFRSAQTVITRADVSDPTAVTVTDNIVLDGSMISSRRIGDYLYFASRYYPQVPGVDPYGMDPESYRAAIEAADLASLMPNYQSKTSLEEQPLVDPGNCFVARTAQTDNPYYSPDIVTLGVVDLTSMRLTSTQCFLGATETLYASPNAVYLATSQWAYYINDGVPVDPDDGPTTSDSSYDPRVQTDIHQFNIDGGSISYIGSGVVNGHLGWNPNRKPFRLSEKDGYLRVATYSADQSGRVSPVNLTVLQPGGNGRLNRIAELPNAQRTENIGKPGEELYASRFLGNKAYLVTFRQTDPLYVVDLSNPADPYLAGEIEIQGYSDYLHPIGDDYLLGLGKDAVPASDGWGDGNGAITQGLKLSLFNVSNPREPREVQSLLIGQRGTEAEALYNHRGITVQRATDQHPTRIAFGIDVAGNPSPTRPSNENEAWQWYDWNFTGLHGFEVRTGSDAGIVNVGVMRVESNNGNNYYRRYGEDRSVIVNDSVFYIHGPEVFAGAWNNMSNYVGPR